MRMWKFLAVIALLPLARFLVVASAHGAEAAGYSPDQAWALAVGLTALSWVFAGAAKSSGKYLYHAAALVMIAFLANFDTQNFANNMARTYKAPEAIAAAAAQAEQAEVDRAQIAMLQAEDALSVARQAAEDEKFGLGSKAGEGPKYKSLVAAAALKEQTVQERRQELTEAKAALARAQGSASTASAEKHLLAEANPWLIFAGFFIIEAAAALIGWFLGDSAKGMTLAAKSSDHPLCVVNNITGQARAQEASEELASERELAPVGVPVGADDSTSLRRYHDREAQRLRRAGF